MDVTIVTLNCEGTGKGWFEGREEAVVRGLRPHRPDVVCLQEVSVRHRDGEVYDQARALGEALGLEYAIFDTYGAPKNLDADHQNGMAILSRWPFRHIRDRRLPHAERHEPDGRVVLQAELEAPGGPLTVVTTHLAWRPDDEETRLKQADLVFDVFVEGGFAEPGARTLFAGDLNATPDEEVVARCRRDLQDVWEARHPGEPGHTWVPDNPLTGDWDMPARRLDYVFTAPGVEVRRAEIVLDRPDPTWASDHFGLLAELRWP